MMFFITSFCSLLQLAGLAISFTQRTTYQKEFVQVLTAGPKYIETGIWQEPAFCTRGSYAVGYSIKEEVNGGITTFQGIKLQCAEISSGHRQKKAFISEIWSSEGTSGTWTPMMRCNSISIGQDALTKFQFRLHVDQDIQGSFNGIAIDYVELWCRSTRDGHEYKIANRPLSEINDSWIKESKSCPNRSAVCGIQTSFVPETQAFNDIVMFCCNK